MVTAAQSAPAAANRPLASWQRELLDAIEQEMKAGSGRPCLVTIRFDGSGAFQVLVGRPVKYIRRESTHG